MLGLPRGAELIVILVIVVDDQATRLHSELRPGDRSIRRCSQLVGHVSFYF